MATDPPSRDDEEVEYIPPPWQPKDESQPSAEEKALVRQGVVVEAEVVVPERSERRSRRRGRRSRRGSLERSPERNREAEFAKVAVLGDEALQKRPLDDQAEALAKGLARGLVQVATGGLGSLLGRLGRNRRNG